MEALLKHGSVRIGTLFDYRKTDVHGEMTGDDREGTTELTGNIISYDPTFMPEILVDSTVKVTDSGADELRHFTNHRVRSTNLYTFSTSATYTSELHQLWIDSEGYDACYRINSARLFFKEISRHLPQTELLMVEPAYYFDSAQTNHIFTKKFHPALLKRSDHAEQQEIRALWRTTPPRDDISPVIIKKSSAGTYCDEFKVLNSNSAV